jgi:hypothetical protein
VNFFRKAYSVINALLVLEFLAQFFLIGLGLFTVIHADNGTNTAANAKNVYATIMNDPSGGFGLHFLNGLMIIPVTTILLIIFSFAARYPWRTTGLTALLFLLLVIQDALAGFFFDVPAEVNGLHPVNGTLILGLGVWLLVTRWAFGNRGRKMMSSNYVAPKV